MTLKLYMHPLASFAQKVVMALYESDLAFESVVVDLGDERSRDAFFALWPMGKMPVLRDEEAGRTVAETTIILEYLARQPEAAWLVPDDPDVALEARFLDRFFDLYVQQPMQKIVLDRLRAEGAHDPVGVQAARVELDRALNLLESQVGRRPFAAGDRMTLADCAAAPALFYAHKVQPFDASHPAVWAYFQRLKARPSYARVLAEAEPYMGNFPQERRPAPAGA